MGTGARSRRNAQTSSKPPVAAVLPRCDYLARFVGDQLLMVSTIVLILLVPAMIIAEMLQRYLGVYPG